MNEAAPTSPTPSPTPPPFIPPTVPPGDLGRAARPLGANPEERVPIRGFVGAAEALMREPRRVLYQLRQPGAGHLILAMLLIGVLCSLVYGFVAGTFSGGTQLWAAPVKLAGGLLLAAAICLPSLYIFACLGGAQARLVEIAGLVAGLLALLSVLLLGFAPVAWVFSQSTGSLPAMGALHLGFGLVASFFGLRFLSAGFGHYSAQSSAGVKFWIIIFLLVALQMTTALRPIIGQADTFLPPPTEKKFFVGHWADCLKDSGETKDDRR
jgi:hypothetical protein